MLDANTLIFAAGNLVELLNIQTKEQKYIRSTGGGGIGAITVSTKRIIFSVCVIQDVVQAHILDGSPNAPVYFY